MPLTEDDVRTALMDCYDPEIPVNIVDLGLIYSVAVEADPDAPGLEARQRVHIDITMTSPGCPAHQQIIAQVQNRLAGVRGISETKVNLVWEPTWTPERISPAGRKHLGID